MIVIGVDVHKRSLTAVAVDEVGRPLAEHTAVDGPGLLEWRVSLPAERLWALEDCRQLTRPLERELLAADERLVRVPPKLTAPERRAGRTRGKSDPIDALAVARAALREPRLDHPRPQETRLRELKLLVDHRDDLVDERRRAQQRLRWHLHELDPTLAIPAGALDRAVWLDRLTRRLARGEQTVLVRIARELIGAAAASPARSWLSTASSSDGSARPRRGCSRYLVAARSALPSCWQRSVRSNASTPTPNSPATLASPRSKPAPASIAVTGSTAAATANSTAPSTESLSPRHACTRPRAPTSNANTPRAKADAKPSAA
jgi:hypothetical protein